MRGYKNFDGNPHVYVSFSGGKDSTVLLHMVRALYPDVPAAYVDTGLEFPEIRAFVRSTENVIGIKEVRLRDTLLRATNATELFSRAQATANRAWEENTALTTEANKRYATTESKLTNLKNKALLFGQQLGDDLNPTVQNLIKGADELLDKFLEMDEAQRKQILQYAAMAAAAGPVLLMLGKVTKGVGTVATGIGKFATAVGKAGGGIKGFLSVLGSSPAVWLAIAAATITATVAFADYVSGAKQAREALKGMEETAKKWKDTAAETFYGSSDGLSFFWYERGGFHPHHRHHAGLALRSFGCVDRWQEGNQRDRVRVDGILQGAYHIDPH